MPRQNLATIIAGIAGVLLPATSVLAQSAHTDVQRLLVRDGNNAGRIDRRANGTERAERQVGAGAEQAAKQHSTGQHEAPQHGGQRLHRHDAETLAQA